MINLKKTKIGADVYDCCLLTKGLCQSALLSVWVAKAVLRLKIKDGSHRVSLD